MEFELDPQIEKASIHVVDMDLCRVLLMNDKRFPWLMLIPIQPDIVEVFDLEEEDQILLTLEVNYAAKILADYTGCQKINIGSLGNIVPQLHMHVVARNADDSAWPGPVWGAGTAEPYDKAELKSLVADLRAALDYD